MLLAAALVPVAGMAAANSFAATRLFASVGPGPTITLKNASGQRVIRVRPGRYTIVVTDRSNAHNFHLVAKSATEAQHRTGIRFVGTVRWSVYLSAGKYRYRCDAHPSSMTRSFSVGAPASTGRPTSYGTTRHGE
jgi:hypothetical protein